jgi:F-type H+-transporting ATPase subunit alpha
VEDCRAFESEFYKFIDNSKPGIWQQIRDKKQLDDALKKELTATVNEFKSRFVKEHSIPVAGAAKA